MLLGQLRQRAFQFQQPAFDRQATGKPAQRTVLGDHPMTGNHDRNGIRSECHPNRPRILLAPHSSRNPPIGSDAAEGDPRDRPPDLPLKSRAGGQVHRNGERPAFPGEIFLQLRLRIGQKPRGPPILLAGTYRGSVLLPSPTGCAKVDGRDARFGHGQPDQSQRSLDGRSLYHVIHPPPCVRPVRAFSSQSPAGRRVLRIAGVRARPNTPPR